jgi:hypothetical protein
MDNFNNTQELPLLSKNTKIAIKIAIAIIAIGVIVYFILKSNSDTKQKAKNSALADAAALAQTNADIASANAAALAQTNADIASANAAALANEAALANAAALAKTNKEAEVAAALAITVAANAAAAAKTASDNADVLKAEEIRKRKIREAEIDAANAVAEAALISENIRKNIVNKLQNNPINPRGGLFGSGYNQYLNLEIDRTYSEITGNCYPRCANDPKCTGFEYNIMDYHDGKRGNCWFMQGPTKFVDGRPKFRGVLDAGNWIKNP